MKLPTAIILIVTLSSFYPALGNEYGPQTDDRSQPEGPANAIFARITGISYTNISSVVGFKYEHRGFTGDGEIGLGACITEEAMRTLIAAAPPFGGTWEKGPVNGKIGYHCAFIYSKAPSYGGITGEERYSGGSPEAVAILSSTNNLYCAIRRGPESMPWHNGTLLVLSPIDATAWISIWDF